MADRAAKRARSTSMRRIGAFVLHGRRSSRETTALARSAFLARFEREADPDRTLPEAERLRRATFLRRAYFTRLALKRHSVGSLPEKKKAARSMGGLQEVRDDPPAPSATS